MASDTKYITTGAELSSIANALRTKTGDTNTIVYPEAFVTAINGLTSLTDWANRAAGTTFSNSTISKIGSFAFGYCTSLTNISIPNVTSIY